MFRAGLSPSRSSTSGASSPFSHLRRSPSTTSLSTTTSPPSTPTKARLQASSVSSSTPTTTRKKTANARAARLAASSPGKAKAAEASLSNTSASATSTPIRTSESLDSIDDVSFEEARTHQVGEGEEEEEDTTAAPVKHNVVVCVRVRPAASAFTEQEELWSLNTAENRLAPTEQHPSLAKRAPSSSTQPSSSTTMLSTSCNDVEAQAAYDFRFDKLVGPTDGTDSMYAEHISPLVRAAVQGYNGTVFAYGQTGSGKTHTMSGTESEPGVITRAVEEVWRGVEAEPNREFLLRVSYLEIYNETLRDLLAPLPSALSSSASSSDLSGRPSSPTKGGSTPTSSTGALRIIETPGRVQVVGLREDIVTSPAGVLSLLAAGQAQRQTAATDWNERSSRSHCVFTITIESRANEAASGKEVRVSQLNLIDLAGSERAASSSERRKEGAFINKSLLTLGTVIAKLSEASSSDEPSTQHIPYRDSKLTRLLQNSLGGNARVAVVCTMSPAKEHAVESLSTLKFGRRCKQITTRARRGTVLDDKALLQRYKRELDRLRARLDAGGAIACSAEESTESLANVAQGEQRVRELESRRENAERDVAAVEQQRSDLRDQVEHLTRLILTSQSVAEERKRQGTRGMSSSLSLANLAASSSTRGRPRFSDFGPASPSKRQTALDAIPASPATTTTPGLPSLGASRPFAVEAELASLRRELAAALTARQAAEAARSTESAQWAARAEELENTNRALEEDLDAADEWCKKAKADLAEASRKAVEASEANRLLSLVAKSKAAREGSDDVTKAREEAYRLELENAKREAEVAATTDKQRIQAEAETAKHLLQAQVGALKEQLERERKTAESVRKELSQLNRESLQENAERDFAQLVRGASTEGGSEVADASTDVTAKRTIELDERAAELERKALELERREEEVEKVRASFRPLPVPQPPLDPTTSVQARVELERRVKELEQQTTMLQRNLESAQRSAAAAAAAAVEASLVPSSPSRQTAAERADIVELQVEVDVQRSHIASLERQLTEARIHRSTMPGSPSKMRDWSASEASPSTPTPASPLAARRYDRFGALMTGTAAAGGAALNRGGSVREYRKYTSTPDSPFNAGGASFAPRTRLSAMAGDLNASGCIDAAAIEAAVRAEREEITRLNAVIASQRALMADLEKSVALWKERLQLQQNIIEKLMQGGESAVTGGAGRLQEVSFNTGCKRLSNGSSVMSAVARASPAPSALGGHEPLRRAGSTASYISRNGGTSSPYYGAHTFNRPAGLGLAPPSPSKGIGAWTGLSGVGGPEPLPMPERLDAEEHLRRSRKPRRTIDNDLKALSSSPRVEATKHRLLEPQSQTSPTKFAKPLPVPGRATRDFYI